MTAAAKRTAPVEDASPAEIAVAVAVGVVIDALRAVGCVARRR